MSDLWVFGYGSLMWRPGFDHEEAVGARVAGYHRALCVFSWVHRGTQARPGLVLGLDRGGSCRGIAYRIAGDRADTVIDYLRAREMVTAAYREIRHPVRLDGGRSVEAIAYVVNRGHVQYAGRLEPERLLALVRQGRGQSGTNPDYVVNTVRHLRQIGIADRTLEWLAGELERAG
jgi:cation transport protein ChaC